MAASTSDQQTPGLGAYPGPASTTADGSDQVQTVLGPVKGSSRRLSASLHSGATSASPVLPASSGTSGTRYRVR
jgi:hypothetical protein